MKEILVWGNPEEDFKRLGVSPNRTYYNNKRKYSDLSVYEVSDADYEILSNDDSDDLHETWRMGCWRYAEGASIQAGAESIINGIKVESFTPRQCDGECEYEECIGDKCKNFNYDTLLDFFLYALGVSAERNVAALAAEMAKENGLTVGELFTKLEPIGRE